MGVPKIITEAQEDRAKFMIVYGQEGIGKSSLGAHAPGAIFMCVGQERGLETLIQARQIPQVPYFKTGSITYQDTLDRMDWLLNEKHNHKTLVIDTLNGVETQCHQTVCDRDFGGDMSNKGFLDYYVGYKSSLSDWRKLLKKIDDLRDNRKMGVIALCHRVLRRVNNPEGKDYDKYEPGFTARLTWDATYQMADAVLYMAFNVTVDQSDMSDSRSTKGKASGGRKRILHATSSTAFDAKNRLGLPAEINADGGGQAAWKNLITAISEARKKGAQA